MRIMARRDRVDLLNLRVVGQGKVTALRPGLGHRHQGLKAAGRSAFDPILGLQKFGLILFSQELFGAAAGHT